MRIVALSLLLAACGGGDGPSGDPDPDAAIDDRPDASEQLTNGFRLTSADLELAELEEHTFCYFFRTPNTGPLAVNHWTSDMTAGTHQVIMMLTDTDAGEPGTVSDVGCDFLTAQRWIYSAQTLHAELALPADDGTGQPLAQTIPADSSGFLQIHAFNPTNAPATVRVTVDATALDDGVPYTETAGFITYDAQISIAGPSDDHVETSACDVPAGTKFWFMSTQTHKQSVATAVRDGATDVFASTDWAQPGASLFPEPATFFEFATSRITYECIYDHPGNNTIITGPSFATNEICMAIGFYFPAERQLNCVGNVGAF